jgi:FkbM family methyltransferase
MIKSRILELIKDPLGFIGKLYVYLYTLIVGVDPLFKNLEKKGIIEYNQKTQTYVRDVRGHRFNLNPKDGGISKALARDGIREKESVDALYKYLNPNMNILDLGSNIGFYLLLEAQIIKQGEGSGRIIGCEPFLSSVELSKLNVEENNYQDLVDISHAAISDKTGSVRMATSSYSNCHQLLSLTDNKPDEYYEVPGYTLVDFLDLASMTIEELDFLRMDVEGAEYTILPTIYKILESKAEFLMFIEFHPHINKKEHINVMMKLEEFGFECLDATKEYLDTSKGLVKREHRPDATIKDLYEDTFYTDRGGCEVFLGKGISKN